MHRLYQLVIYKDSGKPRSNLKVSVKMWTQQSWTYQGPGSYTNNKQKQASYDNSKQQEQGLPPPK